jgi:hypothetical protein
MADFLAIEADTSKTFLRMASTTADLWKKNWYVENARKAYDTMLRFIPRATLNQTQTVELEGQMHELRRSLEQLGQEVVNDDAELPAAVPSPQRKRKLPHKRVHQSISERVRLFELFCSQLRAYASIMVQQNHDLMHVARHRLIR